jgi:uncharacterized protein
MSAFRFDIAEISGTQETSEGFIRAKATFARDGILEYTRGDGTTVRELREPLTNQNPNILSSYGSRPVTIEHPPFLLSSQNAKDYTVGMTDSQVSYDSGFVRGSITLFDSEAIRLAKEGKKIEISAGYQCDIDNTPGVWNGQRYDAKQTNVRVNHVCLTSKGRAGENVRLHLDSMANSNTEDIDIAYQIHTDSFIQNTNSRMDTVTIRVDGVDYPGIPVAIAPLLNSKIQELEAIKTKFDSQNTDFDDLQTSVEELEEEKDRERGRADALELQLEELRYELETRNDAECAKCAGKKMDGKKKISEEEDEDMEDEDMEEEDIEEEEMPFRPKNKKGKKMDSKSVKDLVSAETSARIDALAAAELIFPNIRQDGWEPSMSAIEIQSLVLQKLDSDFSAEGLSDAYIQGRFDAIAASSSRQDSGFVTEAVNAISLSRGMNSNPYEAAQTNMAGRVEANWQEPLAYSRAKH